MSSAPTPIGTEEDLHRRARERVDMKMGFVIHAMVFLLVNLGMFAARQWTDQGHWGFWPAWGWGLGLAIHGIVTFMKLQGEGLKDRLIAEEVQRLRRP